MSIFFVSKTNFQSGVTKCFSNGTVYWRVASSITGMCAINTRYFPYDKHSCGVVLTAELAPNYVFNKMFQNAVVNKWTRQNSDWKLIKRACFDFPFLTEKYQRNVSSIHMVDERTSDNSEIVTGIIWIFEYERTPAKIINSFLIPFIIVMTLSNFVYLIEHNSADRLGYLTTMGLSLMILISSIGVELPNAPQPDLEPLINDLYKIGLVRVFI